jgi:ABC-type transporter Mla subunit MlaD
MSAKSSNFKLGMFVLAGIGVLCAGLFAFGAASYFQKMHLLETYLTGNVHGLSVGSPVTLRGVKVGQVTRLDLSWNVYGPTGPQYVIVEFELRSSIAPAISAKGMPERVREQVEKGLRARLKAEGFTGANLLSLEYMDPAEYPPPPIPWTPRHPCIPPAPSEFDELLGSVQKTLHNVGQLDIRALNSSIERTLATAERLIAHLDEVNFRGIATNADGLITQLRSDLKDMQLAKVANDADETLKGVKATLGRVDMVLDNVDTASLNDSLANMRLATKDLDDTLRKLQKYPAGFLLGRPPPPAKSVEKARK